MVTLGDWCEGDESVKDFSYVILARFDGESYNEELAKDVEALMSAKAWDLSVREPRYNEAEGTYYKDSRGGLQILGFSIKVPEEFEYDLNKCYDSLI